MKILRKFAAWFIGPKESNASKLVDRRAQDSLDSLRVTISRAEEDLALMVTERQKVEMRRVIEDLRTMEQRAVRDFGLV